MRAVILAAGEGSRLRPHFSGPKPLINLLGLSLIERNILSLQKCGISEFIIITGCYQREIKEYLGDGKKLKVSVTYLNNPDWKLGNGVSANTFSTAYRKNEKYILIMADHIFSSDVFSPFIKNGETITDEEILLAADSRLKRIWDVEEATKIKCKGDTALELGKKLTDYNGVDCGLFIGTVALIKALEKAVADQRYNLTDAVNSLASKGKVKLHFINEDWVDVDDRESYKQAEKILLKSLIPAKDGFVSRFVNRKFSIAITKLLCKTNISPNQITFLSFLTAVASGFTFAFGHPFFGGLLAQFCSILDGTDGEIARLKFLQTDLGGIFDAILDRYADYLIVIGMSYYLLSETYGIPSFLLCASAIAGLPMSMLIKEKYHSLTRKTYIPEVCDGILRHFPANRDGRLFIIMIGGILNQILATLFILATITHIQALGRLVRLRKML